MTDWPTTEAEAVAVQDALRGTVLRSGPPLEMLRLAAGVDVAYDTASDLIAGAVVVLDVATRQPVAQATVVGRAAFPYVPGLLAFREIPILTEALRRLPVRPDVLVCDGYGLAHPRRFGLACHLGVRTDLPSVGVAKTPFVGRAEGGPGDRRGATADLLDGTEVIGRALRTRDGVKPVYVSIGHRVDLDTACALTLALSAGYRLPETTRQADSACRAALRGALSRRNGTSEDPFVSLTAVIGEDGKAAP
ncbi:endonuclease V [Cryptosporangium arvum]|uniref:endonuclease V n=1 Tax=Cryptosporangium arvum TaxID=80871 RepID=UPI0004AEC9C6|nr:endonuclease V [Cryptosporangium arvum]